MQMTVAFVHLSFDWTIMSIHEHLECWGSNFPVEFVWKWQVNDTNAYNAEVCHSMDKLFMHNIYCGHIPELDMEEKKGHWVNIKVSV